MRKRYERKGLRARVRKGSRRKATGSFREQWAQRSLWDQEYVDYPGTGGKCVVCGEPATCPDHCPPVLRFEEAKAQGVTEFVRLPMCRACNTLLADSIQANTVERVREGRRLLASLCRRRMAYDKTGEVEYWMEWLKRHPAGENSPERPSEGRCANSPRGLTEPLFPCVDPEEPSDGE